MKRSDGLQRFILQTSILIVLSGCGMTGGTKSKDSPAAAPETHLDTEVTATRMQVPELSADQVYRALNDGPVPIAQEKYTNQSDAPVELEWNYEGTLGVRSTVRIDRWAPPRNVPGIELAAEQIRAVQKESLKMELVTLDDDEIHELSEGGTLRRLLPGRAEVSVRWQVRLPQSELPKRIRLGERNFVHWYLLAGGVRIDKTYTDFHALEALDWEQELVRKATILSSGLSRKPLFEVGGILR